MLEKSIRGSLYLKDLEDKGKLLLEIPKDTFVRSQIIWRIEIIIFAISFIIINIIFSITYKFYIWILIWCGGFIFIIILMIFGLWLLKYTTNLKIFSNGLIIPTPSLRNYKQPVYIQFSDIEEIIIGFRLTYLKTIRGETFTISNNYSKDFQTENLIKYFEKYSKTIYKRKSE